MEAGPQPGGERTPKAMLHFEQARHLKVRGLFGVGGVLVGGVIQACIDFFWCPRRSYKATGHEGTGQGRHQPESDVKSAAAPVLLKHRVSFQNDRVYGWPGAQAPERHPVCQTRPPCLTGVPWGSGNNAPPPDGRPAVRLALPTSGVLPMLGLALPYVEVLYPVPVTRAPQALVTSTRSLTY